MKKQAGFTLIELVAVMVILAILSVVAVPHFLDMRVEAANASAAGVGGAIASGSALNYAGGVATNAGATVITGCTAAMVAPMVSGATLNGANLEVSGRQYVITGDAAGTAASGEVAACQIEDFQHQADATPQDFSVVGCDTVGTC